MQMNFTLVIKRCVYCCYYILRLKLYVALAERLSIKNKNTMPERIKDTQARTHIHLGNWYEPSVEMHT